MPLNKYKIALIGYRLDKGGAEKVMANLSIFFSKKGIAVHNCIVVDEVGYDFEGELLNLGKLKNKSNSLYNKIKRFWIFKKFIADNNFDFIIDFRFRNKPFQELLIAKFIYNSKTIYTVHSYLIDHYISNFSFLARLTHSNAFAITTLTDITKNLILDRHHIKTVKIHNPVVVSDLNSIASDNCNLPFEFIIGSGQMETNIKQFDILIMCYCKSLLPKNNIHLVILGEGILQDDLKKLVINLGFADKVHFLGFKKNPYLFYKAAKYFVLTSANEGFPNVLLESLACEAPVIAFDCLAGPAEIIIPNQNGILVENQNQTELIKAMNVFITDVNFYDYCKQNTFKNLDNFSIETIGNQWLDLMQIK